MRYARKLLASIAAAVLLFFAAWVHPAGQVAYFTEDDIGRIEFTTIPCAWPELIEAINPRFHKFFYTFRGIPKAPGFPPFVACYAVLPDGSLVMMTPNGPLPPVEVDGVLLKAVPGVIVPRLPDPSKTEV